MVLMLVLIDEWSNSYTYSTEKAKSSNTRHSQLSWEMQGKGDASGSNANQR